MTKITPEMRASDAFVVRRAWLVPICLCVIAANHAYQVFTFGQTAWKGGGFGMFSTVDAENARFIKTYVHTKEGEQPVELPQELQKHAAEVRAAPSQAGLNALATRLAKFHWQDHPAAWQQLAEHISNQPGTSINAGCLHPAPQEVALTPQPLGLRPVLKPCAQQTTQAVVKVNGVRLELWRYRYHAATQQLTAELQYTSQTASEEP
jgi:hypothetical protein